MAYTAEQQAFFDATLARMKAEILKDIATGRVPGTVTTFGELHDYVDANYYGGMIEDSEGDSLKGLELIASIFPDPAGSPDYGTMNSQAGMDVCEELQNACNAWLEAGRPEAEVPELASESYEPAPEPVATTPEMPVYFPGFEQDGMQITNPTASSCGGRFLADPEKDYGFVQYHTGGGCMALHKELPDGSYILLTDVGGDNSRFLDDKEFLIGLYAKDGECLGTWTMPVGVALDDAEQPENDLLKDGSTPDQAAAHDLPEEDEEEGYTVAQALRNSQPESAAEWEAALPKEVLECPVLSAVGEDSTEVIAATHGLLKMMADISATERAAIIAAAAHQCRVFYFG